MKTCIKCGIKKPQTEFHRDKTRADGLFPYCKPCKGMCVLSKLALANRRAYGRLETTRARHRAYCKSAAGKEQRLHLYESKPTEGPSLFRGVSYNREKAAWEVRVWMGEDTYIRAGMFDTEHEAGLAYDIKAKELLGDATRPNYGEHTCTLTDIPGRAKGKRLSDSATVWVDDRDSELLCSNNWFLQSDESGHTYAVSTAGMLHKLILGVDDDTPVHHKDRNTLNNCRNNLLVGNTSANRSLAGKSATCRGEPTSSIFKGVSKTRYGLWVATCHSKRLGLFPDEVGAARAYDETAIREFGVYARTNIDLGLLPSARGN